MILTKKLTKNDENYTRNDWEDLEEPISVDLKITLCKMRQRRTIKDFLQKMINCVDLELV